MKRSNWFKQTPKKALIRGGVCLLLLAGLIVFRRQTLTRYELKAIIVAAVVVLFLTVVNLFGARRSEASEENRPEQKR
jgi:FtsH-binding integral membrane protein